MINLYDGPFLFCIFPPSFVPQSGNNLSDKHKPGAQNSGINFKQMAGQLWIVLCCNVVNILFPMFSGRSLPRS